MTFQPGREVFGCLCLPEALIHPFNLQGPRLCDVELDSVDLARSLQRYIVDDGFLKVLTKAKSGSTILSLMAKAVRELLKKALAEHKDMESILKVVITELLLVADYLSVLCGEVLEKPQEALDGIMKANSETADTVRNLVNQTAFWMEQQKKPKRQL